MLCATLAVGEVHKLMEWAKAIKWPKALMKYLGLTDALEKKLKSMALAEETRNREWAFYRPRGTPKYGLLYRAQDGQVQDRLQPCGELSFKQQPG